MIARGMSHVSFPVHDLDRALAFYRDVLGFESMPRPELGVRGAWLRAGDAEVHLIVRFDGMAIGEPPPTLNPAAQHIALRIDDYPAAVASLRAHGLDVLETNAEMGQLWVKDPDGHIVELTARR